MDREAITAAFDTLDAALEAVAGLRFDALTTREWLGLLERCERVRRRLPAAEHPLINNLARQATAEELGGTLSHAIADWTLTSRAEAARRIREAADLGERRALNGEPLAPVLPDTTVNFGGGAVTAPTTVDVTFLKFPKNLSGLGLMLSGQLFGGARSDLGLGPNLPGYVAAGEPTNIVTTALPGQLSQGELINQSGGYLEFGPNPLTPIASVAPATYTPLNVSVNGGTPQAVSVLIDSGGSVGSIPENIAGQASLPVGTQITVYASDGSTVLYSYTTTATNSPQVTAPASTPIMNTGNEPFAQAPVYVSNSPSGMGKLDGQLYVDMP